MLLIFVFCIVLPRLFVVILVRCKVSIDGFILLYMALIMAWSVESCGRNWGWFIIKLLRLLGF
jgi:hypothetical protein